MKIVSFSPFEQVDSLRHQIDRVFADIEGNADQGNFWQPAMELIDDSDNLILRMPLAGVSKEDIEIEASKKSVTISGERHRPASKSSRYLYSELHYGKFKRKVNLPISIVNTQVKANYEAGILTLMLPKVEEAKHKVVKINLAESTPMAATLPETESATEELELASA
ncbi:MAG: Hsp20/alpha crystallin family protein [Waterburya sp.]